MSNKNRIEVGTPVHYWPSVAMAATQRMTILNADKAMYGHVVHVFHDRMVNLVAFDHTGLMHAITSVSVFYPGEVVEEGRDHCAPIRSAAGEPITGTVEHALKPFNLGDTPLPTISELTTTKEQQFPTPAGHAELPDTVSLLMVESEVLAEYHMNAFELASSTDDVKSDLRDGYPGIPVSLKNTDICLLVMRNGHVIVGTSACISAKKYSRTEDRRYARENAIDLAWKLMGYELRTRLYDAGAIQV